MIVFNTVERVKKLPNDVALDYIYDALIVGLIFAICLFAFFWWDNHKNE